MGRDCGYLALMAGIAGGAEMILIPEIPTPLEEVADCLSDAYLRGKAHGIIIVAEGYKPGTQAVIDYLAEQKEELGFSMRVTVLGHVQRGGSPTSLDRVLAAALGVYAVDLVAAGRFDRMVAWQNRTVVDVAIAEAVAQYQMVDPDDALVRTARGLGIAFGDELGGGEPSRPLA
jgi:6-phosphofructokinase